ncbi:MAG: caspase family protein [Crocosphaera sp.]|nr:caspase family protein [Crocosphaera sp.]
MIQQWEALIVGIDDYPIYTTLHNLTVARKDAEDVAKQLESYGYETFRIQRLPQQPYQKGEDPNISRLGVKLEELKDKIKHLFNPPSQQEIPDLALFYFSGHGWRKIIDEKEDTCLATSDVFPNAEIYGISLSWLGKQIQKSPVKKIIIWLDCCFSGELINYLPENKDYCLITATRSFETGLEISYEQGLFTQTLLEGLNPENYADGIVDSYKLKEFIEKKMAQTSQRPLIENSPGSILLTTRYTLANFKDECPYRSLSYFTETREDAEVFYGRSKITNYLINRLQKDRFICVLGASGSGKSSLLRAGLLYQLKLGQMIPGSNLWTYLTPFSPTEKPLQQLKKVGWVEQTKPNFMKSEVRTQKSEVSTSTSSVTSQKSEVGINKEIKIIMIIDQFEECFTMCDESTREAFFKQLIELLNDYPNLHIILGMRSDFRGRLREHKNLIDCLNKPYINIEHLNHEEIEEAIAKPAEKSGVLIESSLKQQLINDVEDYPGSLPLLEYTLTQLWQETRHQGERFLTLKTYQDLGGIEGTLEKRANEVYDSLDKKEKEIAQRIFLELTQVGDTFDTRRRVYLHDLINSHHGLKQLDEVTQKLANEENRLVTRTEVDTEKQGDTPNSGSILIDVVHEALIRNWGKLREWKDKYQEAMVIERKIESSAKEWQNKAQKSDYLLQESQLAEAKEYLKNYGSLGMLDGIAEDYIQQSITQDKQNRLRRRLVVGGFIGVVLLGSLTSTFFGIQSRKMAKVATLKEQAARVKNLLTVEPLEALLLAIGTTGENAIAWQVPKILPEVRSSLYAAIDQVRERNTLEGHQSPVRSVAISEDGATIVSASYDNTVKVWDRQGKLLHTFEGHQEPVESVAISKDGEIIVSGSYDNTVKVWNREGTLVQTLSDHKDRISSVAISKDGETIVSGSYDNTVKIWNREGKLLHTFEGHQESVESVAISKDGETIVSGSYDNTIKVWNREGILVQTLSNHKDRVSSVAISNDGETIISGSYDNTIKVWDRQGTLLHTYVPGNIFGSGYNVTSVSISADGKTIVSGNDKIVKVWDRQGRLLRTLEDHQPSLRNVIISENGETIISKIDSKTFEVRDRQGRHLDTLGGVTSVALSKDGQIIVTGSFDGAVKVWDRQGKLQYALEGHQGYVYSVAISKDRQTIVSASEDNTVKVWDRQGTLLHTLEGHQESVGSVAISEDGQTIISGSNDNTLKVWDRQGTLLYTLEGHQNAVMSVAINEDGQTIISGSNDNTLKVWRGINGHYLLKVGCERLQYHPVLLSFPSSDIKGEEKREAETAEKAAETCLNYGGWSNEEKAEFLVRKSFAIAEETQDIKAANRKLKQAKKLDNNIDIKSLQQEVKQLAESILVK